MSSTATSRTVGLGELEPARSRHAGRRSALALTDECVVVGTADGEVVAFDSETLAERWRALAAAGDAAIVSMTAVDDGVAVGERSSDGEIRLHDGTTGEVRWRFATGDDLGPPQQDSRFFRPFVADIVNDGDRVYAAARRYARDGDDRAFTSVVYAVEADGTVAWTYETDASPISLDVAGSRVAVAYNRCPGEFQHGLAVLDADSGAERQFWDPGTAGQRRVGDVSLLDEGLVVASHGDYRGYRLGPSGGERWAVDLATPRDVDGETLYAYPNHVHATDDAITFLTGNTYATAGRETESLHPDEHTVFGVAADGERVWSDSVGGFASEIGVDGTHVAVPAAQHFRTRDPDGHGLRVFDVRSGCSSEIETRGIVTAAALDGDTIAAVEEPVVYHDEGECHGAYRLLVGTV